MPQSSSRRDQNILAVILSCFIAPLHQTVAARASFEINSPFAKTFLKRIDAGIDILSHYAIIKEPSAPKRGSHGKCAWTGVELKAFRVGPPLNRSLLRAVLLSLRILRKHCLWGCTRGFEIDSPFAKNLLKRSDAGIDILSYYAIMKEPSLP